MCHRRSVVLNDGWERGSWILTLFDLGYCTPSFKTREYKGKFFTRTRLSYVVSCFGIWKVTTGYICLNSVFSYLNWISRKFWNCKFTSLACFLAFCSQISMSISIKSSVSIFHMPRKGSNKRAFSPLSLTSPVSWVLALRVWLGRTRDSCL